ncbi:hypothetical protein QTP88_010614 [Uroleucon formosanum]
MVYYHLLPDCRTKRLIDGVTGLAVGGKVSSGPRVNRSQSVQWTPELEEAFTVYKESLATSTLLAHPHPGTHNQENSSMNDPTSLLDGLRTVMNKIRSVPASHHSNPRSLVFADLNFHTYFLGREVSEQHFNHHIKAPTKYLTSKTHLYLPANEFTTDGQAHALPATAPNTPNQQKPPKTDPSTQPVQTTRSGRRNVRSPRRASSVTFWKDRTTAATSRRFDSLYKCKIVTPYSHSVVSQPTHFVPSSLT